MLTIGIDDVPVEHMHVGETITLKVEPGQSCSRCGEPRDRDGQRYCRQCHAAYMREHRPRYRDLSPDEKLRANCRSYTHMLIQRGLLLRHPCEVCGAKAQAHHADYRKPREVAWLCPEHHKALHRLATATPSPSVPQ